MRVAVISDIHSNYYAFKAVVNHTISQNVNCFIFLGDYVSDLANPLKTMDLLYDIQSKYLTYCLRGNRERYMIEYDETKVGFNYGSETGSLLYTYDNLRSKDISFFKSLKMYDIIEIDGVKIEIAHASKDDDRCDFDNNSSKINDIFKQMTTNYLLTGHCHKQYSKTYLNKTIINPGSVGVPQDKNWFSKYAILNIEDGNVTHTFYKVSYAIEKTIHSQFSSNLMNYSKYWSIGILYDIITGDNWVLKLLENVYIKSKKPTENDWYISAKELGIKFTEKELLEITFKYKVLSMKKILVIGCPGSGKSTFSRKLSKVLNIPVYHLDNMNWNANKTTVPKIVFIERLQKTMQKDCWIIDGNYNSTMEMRFKECDTVFFLDYSLETCLDGVMQRKGKFREDIPWIEEEIDDEFIQFIKDFNIVSKPKILEIINRYQDKNLYVFKTREDADKYLDDLILTNSTLFDNKMN